MPLFLTISIRMTWSVLFSIDLEMRIFPCRDKDRDMSYWAGLVHKELEIDENALPETGVSMPIRFTSKTDVDLCL